MHSKLLDYLSKFKVFNEKEMAAIVEKIPIKTFKKGAVLLKEGEISTQCYFVLEGCVRQYYLMDGEEKTTAFFTERQAVNSFSSYIDQVPSKHYLVCVEDTTLVIGNMEQEQEMYAKYPKLESLSRVLVEQDYGQTQEEFATFITSSPEERYRNLLKKRPELLQRVPQHQIASYLGVTPESLSRIRKRIALKG